MQAGGYAVRAEAAAAFILAVATVPSEAAPVLRQRLLDTSAPGSFADTLTQAKAGQVSIRSPQP